MPLLKDSASKRPMALASAGTAAKAGKEGLMDIKLPGLRIRARLDYPIVLVILGLALVLLLRK